MMMGTDYASDDTRLVCHFAPCAQLARVLYGHGDLVGTPFEYRTGCMAQVYLAAPTVRFVERGHAPLTTYDDTQLQAYYRSIPNMQHHAPMFGSTPLSRRLGVPQPPTSPRRGIPAPAVATTPNRDIPPTSRTSHLDDAPLLRQYLRIALVVSSRQIIPPIQHAGWWSVESTHTQVLLHNNNKQLVSGWSDV